MNSVLEKFWLAPFNNNRFDLFNTAYPIDWSNKKILDFGCNVGQFLKQSENKIDRSLYVGVDLMDYSLDHARKAFPECTFVHYNRWHLSYNPEGNKNIWVNDVFPNQKFDIVIAHSVFSHYEIALAEKEINCLLNLLEQDGCLLITLCEDKDIYDKFDVPACKQAIYLIDYNKIFIDFIPKNFTEVNSMFSHYNMEYFLPKFNSTILLNKNELGYKHQMVVQIKK